MSWLGGKRIAAEVKSALGLAADVHVLVAFDAKLAARLATDGLNVTFISDIARDVERATTPALSIENALAGDTRFGAGALVGAGTRGADASVIEKIARLIDVGGRVALVERVPRPIASRLAMLGGLSDLDQTTVGRAVITSGAVVIR